MQFRLGQTIASEIHVSQDLIREFAALSGDRAPLHVDEAFAIRHGFRGPVVHGAALVAKISQVVGMQLPGSMGVLEKIEMCFRSPVYAPCDLTISATVRQVSEAVSSVVMDIRVMDADGNLIASGKTWHKILGRTCGDD